MQAIILAGGKGKRLHSITEDIIPKPLVPLHNLTLLDHIILHIKNNGCDNIIVCTGHLGDKVSEHINRHEYGIKVTISQETKPLGTAGALRLIKDKLENNFFVLYGDVYTTINLSKMYTFHRQNQADLTLAMHESDHPYDSTIVVRNNNGEISNFIEKPGDKWYQYGNVTTTPLYIAKKNMIKFIPHDNPSDLAKDIFPLMLKEDKKIFGYLTNEFAKDLGTPERYKKVIDLLSK